MLLKFLPKGRISINVYPSSQGCYYKPWQDSIKVRSGQPVNLLGFFIEPRVGGYLQGVWALLFQLAVPGRIYQTESYSLVA